MTKVAFDATLWDEPTTGIGLYAHEQVRALKELGVDVALLGAERSGEAPRKTRSRSLYALAELPTVLHQRPERIFHAAGNFNLPLRKPKGKRFVVTVHDLIPIVRPNTVSRAFRLQFALWLRRSLLIADRVVCVSEFTRTDLLRHFDVDPARVSVVHNGVDHVLRVEAPDATSSAWLDSLALPAGFILYAGSLDVRKNVALVIEAIAQLHARGRAPTLVLVGQRWFGSGAVEARIAELTNRGVDIRPLGHLSAPLFCAIMKRAKVFCFPSTYEGFGLPALEAMALGVPTIVSNVSSLPEVCGDAALSVSPDDAPGLARAIERLLDDPALARSLGARGAQRSLAFTWRAAATKLSKLYDALD